MQFAIFGKDHCPYCVKAVEFAKSRGLDYNYIKIGVDITREEVIEMCAPSPVKTVPQVFVYDYVTDEDLHLGGCDDFIAWVNKNIVTPA